MSDYLTDCDPGDEAPRRHDHNPWTLSCRRCGTFSDEHGSYPSPACNPSQERS